MMRCGKISFDADQNADHTGTDRRDRGRSTEAVKSSRNIEGSLEVSQVETNLLPVRSLIL
jgi:hypothetical protein